MNLPYPFQNEIYIRIAPDGKAFLCTVKFGPLYSKTLEYRVSLPDDATAPLKRRPEDDAEDAEPA